MQGRAILLLVLLSGVAMSLCLGCTSEPWVKEYVKGETTGLQEALNRHTADADRSLDELVKRQTATEEQIKGLKEALEAINKRLTKWRDSVGRLKEEVEKTKEEPSTKIGEEEIINLRAEEGEIEKKFAKLEEIEKELGHLKESQQQDYTAIDKELDSLAVSLNDAKRFVDMNVGEILKAQSRLKEFIIEEVRTERVERQEYAKELESVKGRLQAIEDAMGKKSASDNERKQ